MMKQYYECHITMLGEPEAIKRSMKKSGWSFSQIDGDPDLGKGIKCYATRQFNTRTTVPSIIRELNDKAKFIGEVAGARILRKKVEMVVYDERTA